MSGASKALGGARVSHEAWLERKDRQRREEMSRDAAAKKRSAQDKENSRTGKASLKFSKWLAIKDKYDPDGLFICHHCVGSERWTKESKLNCRANATVAAAVADGI